MEERDAGHPGPIGLPQSRQLTQPCLRTALQGNMSSISLTFATGTNPGFLWLDDLKFLGDDEIEESIFLLRGALAAFFAELADRRNPCSDKTLDDSCSMLRKSAKRINDVGLNKGEEDCMSNLHLYLTGPCDGKKERNEPKAARQYLWLVSIAIGWPYALLILCTFGKWRLQNLLDDERVKILKYVAKNRSSLFCLRLKEKAVQCDAQQIRMSHSLHTSISAKLS